MNSRCETFTGVAWLGRDIDVDVLGAASDLPLGRLLMAVSELEACVVLKPAASGRSYSFSHDLLRATAYAELSGPRAQLVHGAIAAALARLDPELEQHAPAIDARRDHDLSSTKDART